MFGLPFGRALSLSSTPEYKLEETVFKKFQFTIKNESHVYYNTLVLLVNFHPDLSYQAWSVHTQVQKAVEAAGALCSCKAARVPGSGVEITW